MFALFTVHSIILVMITVAKFKKPEALSVVAESAAQMFFGTVFVAPLLNNSNDLGAFITALGLVSSIVLWIISVYLSKD